MKQWVQNGVDLSFSLNVKTVLLGLVDKKQLEIIFLLAKQYIYKALANNSPITFTVPFKYFSNKNMRNNNIWQLYPLPTKNLGIVGVCFLSSCLEHRSFFFVLFLIDYLLKYFPLLFLIVVLVQELKII